jgi:hypothetical protein
LPWPHEEDNVFLVLGGCRKLMRNDTQYTIRLNEIKNNFKVEGDQGIQAIENKTIGPLEQSSIFTVAKGIYYVRQTFEGGDYIKIDLEKFIISFCD